MSDASDDDDEAAMLARMSAAHARRKRPCGSTEGVPTLSQPPEPRAAAPPRGDGGRLAHCALGAFDRGVFR